MKLAFVEKQYDYKTVREFEKHQKELDLKGYACTKHYEIDNNEYKYTAIYKK